MRPRVDQSQLLEVLGDWRSGSGSHYARLAASLRAAIERSDVPADVTLPPERALAEALGVSRSTVMSAYGVLRKAGVVDRRHGSGTWVKSSDESRGESWARFHVGGLIREARSKVSFAMANIPQPTYVLEAVSSLTSEQLAVPLSTPGYAILGLPELREAIAAHYARQGLPTTTSQLLVTTGVQQAIFLVASTLLSSRQSVTLEDPTYLGAIDAFRASSARTFAVPIRTDGIDLDALHASISQQRPALIYVAAVNNPTGAVMSDEARQGLATLAESSSVFVVEDRALAHVTFRGDSPPSIASRTPSDGVIVVESVSKIFWGGLRIGWIRASQALIERLAQQKAVIDLSTPLLSQMAAAHLLPKVGEAAKLLRETFTPRFQVLTELLTELLPSWTWDAPAGGLSLWIRLPAGNATHFAHFAAQEGVTVIPGSMMSAVANHDDHLRLPYVSEPPLLEEGVRRLARAWSLYESFARRSDRYTVVV
jgi:DNA-binding transcriptional MocR family regulator